MLIFVPIRTYSALNERVHWSVRQRRARNERRAAWLLMQKVPVPCTVKLTRIAFNALDDDNLRASLKGCRDGVAQRLGVDDGGDAVRWEYAQERGPRGHYAVSIEVL